MVIAVGNAVLLKPSELAVHTSNVLMELIPQYMDPVSSCDYVLCVCVCACVRACACVREFIWCVSMCMLHGCWSVQKTQTC